MPERNGSFIDIAGKALLTWLVISTIMCHANGTFFAGVLDTFQNFEFGWTSFFGIIRLFLKGIGIFIIFPLLLKGRPLGLALMLVSLLLNWIGYGIYASPFNYMYLISLKLIYRTAPGYYLAHSTPAILLSMNTIFCIIATAIVIPFYLRRSSLQTKESSEEPDKVKEPVLNLGEPKKMEQKRTHFDYHLVAVSVLAALSLLAPFYSITIFLILIIEILLVAKTRYYLKKKENPTEYFLKNQIPMLIVVSIILYKVYGLCL